MNLRKELQDLLKKHGVEDPPEDKKPNGDEDTEKEEENKEDEKAADSKIVTDLADRITDKLVNAIAEKKQLAEADKTSLRDETRSKIFTNWGGMKEISYPSDVTTLSKEEKIVTFFKALMYSKSDPNSQVVLRALIEGTDAEGGYLVPEELRAEVFRILPDVSVMRKIGRTIPMSTDTLKLNTLTARPVAYWTAEYASKSTTSAEFGQVTLTPNDLVCLLPVSDQLLADANINMVQFIVELFTEAIALGEDKAFFTGTGTGQPKGISTETITEVSAATALTFDHVIQLLDSIPSGASKSPRAAFVGHRYVKRILRTLKDTTNNYIWRDGGASNNGETRRLPDTLYGYPFYEQNDIDQEELYFGDWANYIIGDRQTISVRTTTEGGEAWRRNATEIKAVERVDGRAVLTAPFAKITDITP